MVFFLKAKRSTSLEATDMLSAQAAAPSLGPADRKSCLKKIASRGSLGKSGRSLGKSGRALTRSSVSVRRLLPSLSKRCIITKKAVTFDVVDVREYVPSVSCNPSVKIGVAVELGWEYSHGGTHDLDDFEDRKPPRASSATGAGVMRIHPLDRQKMVTSSGQSMGDIKKALNVARKCRKQRRQTLEKIQAKDRKLEEKYNQRRQTLQKIQAKDRKLEEKCRQRCAKQIDGTV
jgi:hypothetical protein